MRLFDKLRKDSPRFLIQVCICPNQNIEKQTKAGESGSIRKANVFDSVVQGASIAVIYKLMNEWDSMSHIVRNEEGEYSGIGKGVSIYYGRQNDYAIASAYAYLFCGATSLSAGDKEAIKTIWVTDETGSRFKMFLKGSLNPRVSGTLLEVLKDQIEKDVMVLFATKGHQGLAPLMLYDLEVEHKSTLSCLDDALRESGFDVPKDMFRNENARTLRCLDPRNSSAICILPTTQLMVITDDQGELSAYLSNCPLCHCTLRQVKVPPTGIVSKPFAHTKYCSIETVKKAWNDYLRMLQEGV